ncbi:MAG: PsbP-related protein [Candidatus Zapsychrus exili]|nr:PsbP-related protein [Candidatus Zapsychrus exili]
MKRQNNQVLFFAIIAIVGISLMATTAWFAFKDKTFRTYKNESKGFSIKYPKTWSYKENVFGAAVTFYSPLENDLDLFRESISVVVQDISFKPMGLKEYTDLAIGQMDAMFRKFIDVVESKPARLGGIYGYKYIFIGKNPDVNLKYRCAWTIKKTSAYQVVYTSLETHYDKYIENIEKMVSSFRILK